MPRDVFDKLVGSVATAIGDRPLDADLETFLNAQFPADGDALATLSALCAEGEADGWLVAREAAGIKYGRAVKPGGAAGRFSVDVVRMKNVEGPHHTHTTGEIGAIMPIAGDARFDGKGRGWYVYPPASAHHPTVTGGEAYVLYLLPEGAIAFT